MGLDNALIAIAGLAAAAYGSVFADRGPSLLRTLSKACATAALAALAIERAAPPLLVAALAFGAAGDVLATADFRSRPYLALSPYLWADLAYLMLFWRYGGGRVALEAEPERIALVAGAFACGVVLLIWLKDGGGLKPTGTLLGLAAMAMTGQAFTLPRFLWPAMAGAVCLMAFAALLTAEHFRGLRAPANARTAWWLSFLGQVAITYAFVR